MTGPVSPPRAALVTGASQGIGEAIAKHLAREGLAIGLVARGEAELRRVQASIEQAGGRAHCVPMDLSAEGAAERAAAEVERALGPVEVLVNNAGVVRRAPLHEQSLKHWDLHFQLNLRTPFLLIRAVLPGMRARRTGWIINISSEAGLEPIAGMGAYAISKAGLNRLTELVALENQALGVRAVSICPGWVTTRFAHSPEEIGLEKETLLVPDDVARTVQWLIRLPAHVQAGPIIPLRPLDPRASLRESTARFHEAAKAGSR